MNRTYTGTTVFLLMVLKELTINLLMSAGPRACFLDRLRLEIVAPVRPSSEKDWTGFSIVCINMDA